MLDSVDSLLPYTKEQPTVFLHLTVNEMNKVGGGVGPPSLPFDKEAPSGDHQLEPIPSLLDSRTITSARRAKFPRFRCNGAVRP